LFAYGIFKVIYSPFKAFKEIIQNPKFVGPLLMMVLFIFVSVGREYARASKLYVQETFPSTMDAYNIDSWTENYTIWVSNANVSNNSNDRVLGYNSVQFDVTNNTAVWMELNSIGQIDCSSADGYKNLTFSMKLLHPTADMPQNSSLYLFSMDTTEYFSYDLAESTSQTENGTWSNFTIPVGPSAEQWMNSSTQATWNNITGLKFELVWAESARSNLTVLLDMLLFQSENFDPLINFIGSDIVISTITTATIGFFIYWILFGSSLSIATKIFRIPASFKMLLIIVGYALIAMVIMEAMFCIFYLLIPPLYVSLNAIVPNSVLQVETLFSVCATLLLPIWSIILSSIGVQTAFDLPANKSIIIAIIGFIPYYVLMFLAFFVA